MKNIFILLIFLRAFSGWSQDQKEQVLSEIEKVSERYQTASHLSFDAHYRYSQESAPDIYLDSLSGNYKLNGRNFWFVLDSTETLFNGEYVVGVYPSDKIIYISRPTDNKLPLNPIAALDSLLSLNNITYSYSRTKNTTLIILDFNDDGQYKQVQYEINNRSGYISRLRQVVRSSAMTDYDTQKSIPESYSIVEIIFDHYRENSFSSNIFDAANYFKKVDDQYIAVAPYQSYKIFLGGTNL